MFECHNKSACTNYPAKCKECWTTADIYNHYPFYDSTPKPPKVAYLCDRRACPDCSYPMCKHTLDISHAVNFTSFRSDGEMADRYIEKERGIPEPEFMIRSILDHSNDYDDCITPGLIEEY